MYSVNTTIDQVINAIGNFIKPLLPANTPVVRGQVNRVPPPGKAFVQVTELLSVDLAVPYPDYHPQTDSVDIIGPTRFDVQLDFYGELSGDWCKVVKNAVRSGWGFDRFPTNVKPLYTSDASQRPLNTGEQQYLSRWTLTLSLQYNPTVELPQQFADELSVNNVILANP